MSTLDYMILRTRTRGRFLIENKGYKVIRIDSDREVNNGEIKFNITVENRNNKYRRDAIRIRYLMKINSNQSLAYQII